MYLSEIFDQLTFGELTQVNMGGGEVGAITPANYKRIVAHVNMGLTALHKRFPLKEKRLKLALSESTTLYSLKAAFAESNEDSDEDVRHILDTEDDPFLDDILKLERVYTEDGFELTLNDHTDPYSLFTPSYNSLRVHPDIVDKVVGLPEHLLTDELDVVYRANHFILNEDNGAEDPEDTDIDLPVTHLQALLYFVASRVHNPIGLDNQFHHGNNYAAKYEAECQRLEVENVNVDQGSQSDRLVRSGWV